MGAVMVAVFFFAATPHDFIHDEIASHKDTVDGVHKHAGVSKVHIHCDFLRVSLSPTLPGHAHIFHAPATAYNICFRQPLSSRAQDFICHFFLRGPPAALPIQTGSPA
jgi:hypothetical protein